MLLYIFILCSLTWGVFLFLTIFAKERWEMHKVSMPHELNEPNVKYQIAIEMPQYCYFKI